MFLKTQKLAIKKKQFSNNISVSFWHTYRLPTPVVYSTGFLLVLPWHGFIYVFYILTYVIFHKIIFLSEQQDMWWWLWIWQFLVNLVCTSLFRLEWFWNLTFFFYCSSYVYLFLFILYVYKATIKKHLALMTVQKVWGLELRTSALHITLP